MTAGKSSLLAGSLAAVISMDRLLRRFLSAFIRRGSMVFTTASGEKFTCGDGTGEPVFARFLTTDAQRRVLLNPELALGEIYMDGDFVTERSSITDALAILLDQPDVVPSWAKVVHKAKGEAVLFSFSDRPVQERLDLWREDRS